MKECRDLFALIHLENTSMQSALLDLIGQARNAVMRMAVEKMLKYDLPSLDEFISLVKTSLEIKEFSYHRDQNGYHIHIEGCPVRKMYKPPLCDGQSVCPLIFLSLCAIKKETGVEAELLKTEHTKDGIFALIRPYFKSWEDLILKVGE